MAKKKNGRQAGFDDAIEASAEADNPPRAFQMDLEVRLSESEINSRALEMAAGLQERDELADKRKSAMAHFKTRIEMVVENIDKLADVITKKTEVRPVECVEERLFQLGVVRIVRMDTGELVSERAMTALERQPSLPLTTPDAPGYTQIVDAEGEDLSS